MIEHFLIKKEAIQLGGFLLYEHISLLRFIFGI